MHRCLKFRLNYSYMLLNDSIEHNPLKKNIGVRHVHESRIMPFATPSMSIDSQLLTKKKTT